MGQQQLLFVNFQSFQTNKFFLQQINVSKCHADAIYNTGIPTHDLLNMNYLPYPLDQGSHPSCKCILTNHDDDDVTQTKIV